MKKNILFALSMLVFLFVSCYRDPMEDQDKGTAPGVAVNMIRGTVHGDEVWEGDEMIISFTGRDEDMDITTAVVTLEGVETTIELPEQTEIRQEYSVSVIAQPAKWSVYVNLYLEDKQGNRSTSMGMALMIKNPDGSYPPPIMR
jgi:hypothetical protein